MNIQYDLFNGKLTVTRNSYLNVQVFSFYDVDFFYFLKKYFIYLKAIVMIEKRKYHFWTPNFTHFYFILLFPYEIVTHVGKTRNEDKILTFDCSPNGNLK